VSDFDLPPARDGQPGRWEALLDLSGCTIRPTNGPAHDLEYRAVLETSLGDITVAFLADKAPMSVRHFLRLASAGVVDGTSFHRVVPGFVIQTGYLGSKPTILDNDQQALAGPQAPAPDPELGILGRGTLAEFLAFARREWG
jgi:hypothetical protein